MLCQSVDTVADFLKTHSKTATCIESIVVYRDGDMSSRCRHNHTGIMTTAAKLLIVGGSATVAEGRQAERGVSLHASNDKRCKVKADSRTGHFVAREGAQKNRLEPKTVDSRVRLKRG